MKTIKIIILIEKISRGEKVPKKIKYNGVTYVYRDYTYLNLNVSLTDIDCYLFSKYNFNILNDEVEILEEEKKIPEKLPLWATRREDKEYTNLEHQVLEVARKVDEILDYLESKEKGDE